MKPNAVSVSGVLGVFALLFSQRWVARWQQQWRASQGGSSRGEGGAPGGRQRKGRRGKKSAARQFYQRVFSLRVTLWYLLFQRLNFDGTLAGVVEDVRGGGADRLGRRGRRLSRRVRSTKTSAYNQARQRMPLELLQGALAHLGQGVLKTVGWARGSCQPLGPSQRPRQLLDGSTLSVLLTPRLAEVYAPARNQSGASDWCLLRIVVGFCARSGAVLSAIEGAVLQSEQVLAWALMRVAAPLTIWIGDRNFGVWSVVAQAVHHRQDVLVRLTRSRAATLCRGRGLGSGQERRIAWAPSRKDQVPPGLERSAVEGRLLYVRLKKAGRWIDLWLFTTLEAADYPLELLVRWYGQRWQAELHFRSVKTQMKLAELDVCTPAMARKEFYAGLLAYSLVRTLMWEAGERLEAKVQALSFSQARRVLLAQFKQWGRSVGSQSAESWAQALLEEVAGHTLPKRRKPRPTEVRRVRHRRQKFPPLKGCRAAARKRYASPKSL